MRLSDKLAVAQGLSLAALQRDIRLAPSGPSTKEDGDSMTERDAAISVDTTSQLAGALSELCERASTYQAHFPDVRSRRSPHLLFLAEP
jgi:hypothetical protein